MTASSSTWTTPTCTSTPWEGTSNKFVLFLHGDLGEGSAPYALAPSAPLLHDNLVMIYLDQRGADASQRRTAPQDIALPMLIDDLDERQRAEWKAGQ